jgi:hypothetical protein
MLEGGLVVRGELLCEKPAGTPHTWIGPLGEIKVAAGANFLNPQGLGLPGDGGPTSAPSRSAEVLFGWDRAAVILVPSPGIASPGKDSAPMRDILIAVLFVAMVLTPAVVAARSGRDLHSDE